QIDPEGPLVRLRDRVLVPVVASALQDLLASAPPPPGGPVGRHGPSAAEKAKPPEKWLEDGLGLLALVPEPRMQSAERAAWDSLLVEVARPQGGRLHRLFVERRRLAAAQRKNPAPKFRAVDFCAAAD